MRFRKFAAALLTAAIALSSCVSVAFAATPEQRATLDDLSVRVECTSTTTVPQETLYIQFTGLDHAPMPEDYVGDFQYGLNDEHQQLMRISFESAFGTSQSKTLQDVLISRITYTKPGTYLYRISQIGGSDPNATYDETCYLLRVTASWENDEFGVTTAVYELDEDGEPIGDKLPEIKFNNHYDMPIPEEPEQPEPPQPEEPETPEIVPEEPETPAETPTETPEKLIQTGQLNWPVPVLAGAGALLMAAGVFCLNKRNDNA